MPWWGWNQVRKPLPFILTKHLSQKNNIRFTFLFFRGLITIQILKYLQKFCGQELHKMFDYVCGVSTGSLLAVMLAAFRWESLVIIWFFHYKIWALSPLNCLISSSCIQGCHFLKLNFFTESTAQKCSLETNWRVLGSSLCPMPIMMPSCGSKYSSECCMSLSVSSF